MATQAIAGFRLSDQIEKVLVAAGCKLPERWDDFELVLDMDGARIHFSRVDAPRVTVSTLDLVSGWSPGDLFFRRVWDACARATGVNIAELRELRIAAPQDHVTTLTVKAFLTNDALPAVVEAIVEQVEKLPSGERRALRQVTSAGAAESKKACPVTLRGGISLGGEKGTGEITVSHLRGAWGGRAWFEKAPAISMAAITGRLRVAMEGQMAPASDVAPRQVSGHVYLLGIESGAGPQEIRFEGSGPLTVHAATGR